jgi:hypothetical protein
MAVNHTIFILFLSSRLKSAPEAEQSPVILERLREQLRPCSCLSLSLMYGGLVEWIRPARALHEDRRENSWVGLGVPRYEFYPNLWGSYILMSA